MWMMSRFFKTLLLSVLLLSTVCSVNAQSTVTIDNGWDGSSMISSIGATGSDYYAQSFIANMSVITRFGVVIQQTYPKGEIYLAIAADDGSGKPNYSAPLYQGTLKYPTTTSAWYYEEGLHISVTPGQKYYVLLNGYNIPGTTGQSAIGYSNTQPIPGEGIIFSNDGGGTWEKSYSMYPLAIYVEGLAAASIPTLNEWGMILFMISLILASLYFMKRFRTA
jgi:hypothetical protein